MTDDTEDAKKSLKDLFVEWAAPDTHGFSKPVLVEDLETLYPGKFKLGNGGGWCRDDGPLGKIYIIKRVLQGGRIVSVKLDGFNDNPTQRGINTEIKKTIGALKCVVLHTSKPQVDHKDGTYSSQALLDLDKQRLEDFQPMSQAANNAKRQHCKRCQETDTRFDATQLGYSRSFILGDAKTKNCRGCYWHDPKLFNASISKDFDKTDE